MLLPHEHLCCEFVDFVSGAWNQVLCCQHCHFSREVSVYVYTCEQVFCKSCKFKLECIKNAVMFSNKPFNEISSCQHVLLIENQELSNQAILF